MNVTASRVGLLGALLVATTCAAAESFDRYDIILRRKPFGSEPVPPPVVVAPVVVPPGESFVNKYRMTAVVRDDAGTLQVGLVDLRNNRNYLMGVGDSIDGVEVVEAEYDRERARLRRGPEDYWVSMAAGSNRFESVTAASRVPVPAPAAAPGVKAARTGTGGAEAKAAALQRLSYAHRRQQREESRRKKETERLAALQPTVPAAPATGKRPTGTNAPSGVIRAGRAADTNDTSVSSLTMEALTSNPDLSEEDIAKLLQEYQKELIRSGQTPLPIPLSPEADQDLVNEGVLPAVEE